MEKRVSIWGDSITWGETDPDSGGWVARLRKFFDADEEHEISVYNLGVHGDTTADLIKRFKMPSVAPEIDARKQLFSRLASMIRVISERQKTCRPPLIRLEKTWEN